MLLLPTVISSVCCYPGRIEEQDDVKQTNAQSVSAHCTEGGCGGGFGRKRRAYIGKIKPEFENNAGVMERRLRENFQTSTATSVKLPGSRWNEFDEKQGENLEKSTPTTVEVLSSLRRAFGGYGGGGKREVDFEKADRQL